MRLDPTCFAHPLGNRAPNWPFGLDRASPQARGLSAAWPLFAGPALGLRDLSGHGAHLTLGASAQTPSWVKAAAFNSHALNFDGGDEAHVAGGDVPSLDITGDRITLSAWIRPDTIGTFSGDRIVSKRTTGGGSDVYAIFTSNLSGSDQGFIFRLRTSSETGLSTGVAVTTGVWQHYAATYDGATMRIYRNGVQVASTAKTGNIENSSRAVYLGHREAESRYFDGAMADVRVYNRALSAREVRALCDPQTRWGLYRELRVPRLWPTAGGPASPSGIASLQAALQRQASLPAGIDAAVQVKAVFAALAAAALERVVPRSAWLDTAMQAVVSAQADLEAALTRSLDFGTGLDANLSTEGLSARVATLDGAIRRLNDLSTALEAALRTSKQGTAALDAPLALSLERAAGLDAAARLGRQLSDSAMQAVLRATPDRAATLDAVIGTLVAAAESRTFKIAARGRHAVAGGQRRVAIPSGNRRH